MADKWSDVNKTSKWILAVVLAASMVGSGCAGLVMGSSPSGGKPSPGPGAPPPPTNTPQPQLSATPMSATFPSVATGTSGSQTITLQNGGTGPVTISSANVTGTGFGTSGLTLPMNIAAGASTTFNVVFTPSVAGSVTGSVSLMSDAPSSPLVISANGSGIAATALLSSNTSSLDFGSVAMGGNSSLSVTLGNSGNASLTISSVLVTGAGFTATGAAANTTLAPGQTATLTVTFAPSAAGGATGSVSVVSSGGGVSIALTGSGGQLSSHAVALNWDPSTSDVVGYFVYRALADGTYAKLNTAPVVTTDYRDTNILSGQTYTYVVTAVDANNVESDYSEPVLATVP